MEKFAVEVDGGEEASESMRNNPHSLISKLNFESKQKVGGEKVPILVCITHADKFLAELVEEDPDNYKPMKGKREIAEHFSVSLHLVTYSALQIIVNMSLIKLEYKIFMYREY